MRRALVLAVCLLSLAGGPYAIAGASSRHTPVSNACVSTGSATNSVVHLYLAIDQRQFHAAFKCFTTYQRKHLHFRKWKRGYAHTVASHLVLADDEVPNGTPATQVRIDLHAINRMNGKLILTSYQGIWHANQMRRLHQPQIKVAYSYPVKHVPRTKPRAIFAFDKLQVLKHRRFDVTGDGIKDDIFVTAAQGCTDCHAQQIWIYSSDILVYQQQVNNVNFIPWHNHLAMQIRTDTPGTKGFNTCCPTQRSYATWFWTRWGFVLHARKIVRVK